MRDACFALTEQASEDTRLAHLMLVRSDGAGRFGPRRSLCLDPEARLARPARYPGSSKRLCSWCAGEDRRGPEALDDQVDRERRLEEALGYGEEGVQAVLLVGAE